MISVKLVTCKSDLFAIFQTTESTYNEYDDSALTDMSEDTGNTSPLLYDSFNPAVDGDDTDSAIAGPTVNMNGFISPSESLR